MIGTLRISFRLYPAFYVGRKSGRRFAAQEQHSIFITTDSRWPEDDVALFRAPSRAKSGEIVYGI